MQLNQRTDFSSQRVLNGSRPKGTTQLSSRPITIMTRPTPVLVSAKLPATATPGILKISQPKSIAERPVVRSGASTASTHTGGLSDHSVCDNSPGAKRKGKPNGAANNPATTSEREGEGVTAGKAASRPRVRNRRTRRKAVGAQISSSSPSSNTSCGEDQCGEAANDPVVTRQETKKSQKESVKVPNPRERKQVWPERFRDRQSGPRRSVKWEKFNVANCLDVEASRAAYAQPAFMRSPDPGDVPDIHKLGNWFSAKNHSNLPHDSCGGRRLLF